MSEPDVYTVLHAEIVNGNLSPGERLVEEELASRLGVGRGPVRAALLRLDHEGLVVREPNRGARVRRVTAEEALEILEARAGLESIAARYAAKRRTSAEVAELQTIVKDMTRLWRDGELLGMSNRNADLHRMILEISRHNVIWEICERLQSQSVRFQFRTVLVPGRAQKSLAEHGRIVDAIAAGEGSAAEAAMRKHLSSVTAALGRVANPDRAVPAKQSAIEPALTAETLELSGTP